MPPRPLGVRSAGKQLARRARDPADVNNPVIPEPGLGQSLRGQREISMGAGGEHHS